MSALAGRRALVRVTGAPVTFTDEATTANVARTIYTITNAAKNLWDPTAAVTVQTSPDGSAWSTASPTTYKLNRLAGKVVFGSAQPVGTQVRVSGSYLPLSTAAGCKAYSYTIAAADLDDTDFDAAGTTGHRSRVRGLLEASGTLSSWYRGDSYFTDAIQDDTLVVIEHLSNSSGAFDLRVWATLNKAALQSAVDGLQEQAVDWQGSGDVDGTVVAVN